MHLSVRPYESLELQTEYIRRFKGLLWSGTRLFPERFDESIQLHTVYIVAVFLCDSVDVRATQTREGEGHLDLALAHLYGSLCGFRM